MRLIDSPDRSANGAFNGYDKQSMEPQRHDATAQKKKVTQTAAA